MPATLSTASRMGKAVRRAAGVDEAGSAHVAVDDLIARQVNGVVRGEVAIYPRARLAERERGIAAVRLRQLLLDEVRFDRGGILYVRNARGIHLAASLSLSLSMRVLVRAASPALDAG